MGVGLVLLVGGPICEPRQPGEAAAGRSGLQLLEAERGLLGPRGVRRADVHVAPEAAAPAGLALDLLESIRHILDVLVVGCDAEAHEAKGHRKPLVEVDVNVGITL